STRYSNRSRRPTGSPRSTARTTPSRSTAPKAASMTPDQQFYENFVCGAVRNYTGYCNAEVNKLIYQQSAEANGERRKKLVWEIERKLAADGARRSSFIRAAGPAPSPMSRGS